MALSQKHTGKYVVPWFCSEEWRLVFQKIYGPTQSKKTQEEALEILLIWKSRTPLLPRGVEGTYIILQALLTNRSDYNTYNIQLLLSTSIMRFLNICAAYDKNQGTFYQTACRINLPEWLINLRHEIAHGQTLPSLYTLDSAMLFCLEWLNREYWIPAEREMKDFIDNTQFQSDLYEDLKTSIKPLVSNYCYCVLATHSNWNIQNVRDIVDEETRSAFIKELKVLTVKTDISLKTVQKLLFQHINYLLNNSEQVVNKNHIVPELLIEEGVFLGDFEERYQIFKDEKELPVEFIQIWEKMLCVMEKSKMIEPLIEKLLQVLIDETKHETKLVAALWLQEIGKSLLKNIFINDLIQELQQTNLNKSEIKRKVNETLATKFKKRLVLNFTGSVNILDITGNIEKFTGLFLEKPNQYTKIFLSVFLDLNDVFKCREQKTEILNLVDMYLGHKMDETEIPEIIHNVEEFTQNETIEEEVKEKDVGTKRWRKITEFNFEKYPIGILPWQDAKMNPLLH